ncbi:MAG: ribulose-phosphate 3-epimerase [Ruminococcaceae bacterium]|nr:ribulose-phosphate 3-epimerase [Oscillospiraceae bacterium]
MIKISPSILSADFSKLGLDVDRAEKGGAEYLHIDVMDGVFVPNISLGAPIQKSIRKQSKMVFDTHLMIIDPIRYVDDFAKAGSDIITIHLESCDNVAETLEKIRSYGIKAGLSIKPKTPVTALKPFIGMFDMLLIMSVEPGFGGQSFIPESLDKIRESRALLPELDIEVDGGINADNINEVVKAGANVIVAGSAVFGKEDVASAIALLRKNGEA